MVPATYHHHDTLPLTANGKVDQAALRGLANRTVAGPTDGAAPAPLTPAEERLAAAWADVLGLDQRLIRRDDSFADLGGTSMAAIKLVIALDRAISLEDLAAHPRLVDLAACLASTLVHHDARTPGDLRKEA
jgi:acyl carrier protein